MTGATLAIVSDVHSPKRLIMKRILLVSSLFLLVGGSAFAQEAEEGEVDSRFYDFGDMLIDGELLRPEGMMATERGNAVFGSLLSLERSFMPEIQNAATEEALQ
jgi:hypothetical protein